MQRRHFVMLGAPALLLPWRAQAHHGWSGFDQTKPLYLEGRAAKVAWRNPHAELSLALKPGLTLPPDLAKRAVPAQVAPVDGPALLAAARLPTRADPVWEIELAPLTRLEAWRMTPIKAGDEVAVLGYAAPGEQGNPVLRAEYLWAGGKVYGLRSSPG